MLCCQHLNSLNICIIAVPKAIYYAMIEELDEWFGVLWEKLKKSGLDKNTIVIFMSDHGEMLGESWALHILKNIYSKKAKLLFRSAQARMAV